MKAIIDVSPAINGKAGLGRYAASVAAHAADAHPGSVVLFANRTRDAAVPPSLSDVPLRTVRAGYKPWRMAVWAAQLAGIGFNRWVGPGDIFHATEHLLVPLRGIPAVLTIHDLIYHLFPQHHKSLNYWYLNAAMPLYVRRADHIITISHNSKRDIMRVYNVPEPKIAVIYEAPAPRFTPQTPGAVAEVMDRYDLPERYIATLGTIEPRKNLPRLVAALAALRADEPDLKLVVIGSLGWLTEGFFTAIKEHGQADAVIRPGFIPDDDLPAVLAGAQAVCQPSLYEGFGLPVLEAMACGVPVVCSATSSLGEIAGDAALTVNPESTAEIAAALRRLLTDADLAADLRGRGLAHAARFTWDRTARETWAVYEKVHAARHR